MRLEEKEPFLDSDNRVRLLSETQSKNRGEGLAVACRSGSPHKTNITEIHIFRKWHERVVDIRKWGTAGRISFNQRKHTAKGSFHRPDE